MAVKSVLAFCGTGSIGIALWQRSQCWVSVGRAVLALHYGSEVGVGFLWDGQYWHCTMAVKSVLISVGRAVLALHYGSEVGVGFLWDGQYWRYTMAVKSVVGFCGMGRIRVGTKTARQTKKE